MSQNRGGWVDFRNVAQYARSKPYPVTLMSFRSESALVVTGTKSDNLTYEMLHDSLD